MENVMRKPSEEERKEDREQHPLSVATEISTTQQHGWRLRGIGRL